MKVQLLNYTPLWVASKAIRKCWASEDKSDTEFKSIHSDSKTESCIYNEYGKSNSYYNMGPNDKALIERVGNKNKHSSTLEHLVYNFDIDGISRACLQELARHRHASLSVKSTRYTLKELKNEKPFLTEELTWNAIQSVCYSGKPMYADKNIKRANNYLVFTGNQATDAASVVALENLRLVLQGNTICKERNASNDKAKYCMPESYKTSLVWTVNARSLQNFLSLRSDKAALWEIRDLAWEIYNALPEEHQYLFNDFMKVYDDNL